METAIYIFLYWVNFLQLSLIFISYISSSSFLFCVHVCWENISILYCCFYFLVLWIYKFLVRFICNKLWWWGTINIKNHFLNISLMYLIIKHHHFGDATLIAEDRTILNNPRRVITKDLLWRNMTTLKVTRNLNILNPSHQFFMPYIPSTVLLFVVVD